MKSQLEPFDAVGTEQSLDRVLEQISKRLQAGEMPELESLIDEFPEQAGRLRELLPAMQVLTSMKDVLAAPEAAPAATLGDYRIIRQIGRGGMGVVYEAEQVSLRRRVALKVLPFAAVMDQRQLARFKNEAMAAAHLQHQNIVPVYGIGSERGVHFYAMQYVEGHTLAEVIGQLRRLSGLQRAGDLQLGDGFEIASQVVSGRFAPSDGANPLAPTIDSGVATSQCSELPLSSTQAAIETNAIAASTEKSTKHPEYFRTIAQLGIQAAEALDHAHKQGVLHRDVKPANFILDTTGNLWVTDFGLARMQTNPGMTITGDLIGTLRYMSPEQALAKRIIVDHRTDIYSLGVTLYELLTLRPAYSGKDREELLKQIAFSEPKAPRRINPAIPAELETITLKAMAKNPDERYATAQELADDLRRWQLHEPIRAKRPSLLHRARKWSQRHRPIVASAAIASAIILIVVAFGMALMAAHERASRQVAERAKDRETEQRLRAERLFTSSYVDQAQALCEAGEIGRGMLLLSDSLRTVPDDATDLQRVIRLNLAAWRGELHTLMTVLQHKHPVWGVGFTQNGSRIVTRYGGFTRLWDAATGEPIGKPIAREKGVSALVFSPDGSRFVTGNKDGTARLWDAATLEPIGQPLAHRGPVYQIAFSRDGSRFVSTGGGTVSLGDAATGQRIGEPFQHERGARAVAITSNGTRALFTIRLGTHQLWDTDRGEPVGPPVMNFPNTWAVAISPDGSQFATGSSEGVVQVWNTATAKPALPPITHGASIYCLAFSPDGSRLASGGSGSSARLWDATTGRAIGVRMRYRGTVTTVAFSSDGQRLLTRSNDRTVRVWDLARQESLGRPIQHEERIWAAAFSPDGLRILTEGDGVLHLRDAFTGEPVGKPFSHEQGGSYVVMVFSPDGSRVVIYKNGYTRLWDVATGQLVGQLGEKRIPLHDVAVSPDGSQILAGYQTRVGPFDEGFGQLWRADPVKPIGEPLQHKKIVSCVAFSPDGSRFLTGNYDATTRWWNAKTVEPIGPPVIHQSEVKSLAYSPDGTRIATGFADWTVRLWDAQTREPLGTPLHHRNIVSGAAFSPDGSRLLTVSLDGTARLWDVATRKPVGPLLRHENAWPRVSFSRDGSELLVSGKDGTARIWDAPPGPLVGERERILIWAQVITGLELDDDGGIGVLEGAAWEKLQRRLQELGGPPTAAALPEPVSLSAGDGRQ